MSDTRPNIALPANTQIDIYAALNAQAGFPAVAVGTAIITQNLGGTTIRLNAKATSPLTTDGYNRLSVGNDVFGNASGDSGAWAYSPVVDSIVNVQEA